MAAAERDDEAQTNGDAPDAPSEQQKPRGETADVASSSCTPTTDEPMENPDAPPNQGRTTAAAQTEAVERAKTYRLLGNEHFKEGRHAEAADAYAAGLREIHGLSAQTASDDEAHVVFEAELVDAQASLASNRALALLKLERFEDAVSAADAALKAQPENLKALYRRGVARSRLDRLDAACDDLARVLRSEPSNRDAMRELRSAREKRKTASAAASGGSSATLSSGKKSAAAKKSKGLGGLYEDVEEARRRKKAAEQRAQEAKRRRHAEANAERVREGRATLSFADWSKAEEEAEKKKDEEAKARALSAERERDEKRRLDRLQANPEVVTIEQDDDLSDADIVRGYKTLADGRKTSYFHAEPDDHAARLLREASTGPCRVDGDDDTNNNTAANSANGRSASSSSLGDAGSARAENGQRKSASGSAWNAAGTTFEERNRTKVADEALRRHLGGVARDVAGVGRVRVHKVKKLAGEASVVIARGTPRYIFEYAATLEWEAAAGDRVATGSVSLPEISSTVCSGSYEQVPKHSSKSSTEDRALGDACLPALRAALDAAIADFVAEYRTCS